MTKRLTALAFGLALLLLPAMPAAAQDFGGQRFQCAPFARLISGIQLFGDAAGWWAQANGRYERGSTPEIGAALVFKAAGAMRVGHVATVTAIVDPRTVKLTHANWSRRGQVEEDVTAIDVSENNDWSEVRVWYAPVGGVGTAAHPAFGFVYPDDAARAAARFESQPRLQLAVAVTQADDDSLSDSGGISN